MKFYKYRNREWLEVSSYETCFNKMEDVICGISRYCTDFNCDHGIYEDSVLMEFYWIGNKLL